MLNSLSFLVNNGSSGFVNGNKGRVVIIDILLRNNNRLGLNSETFFCGLKHSAVTCYSNSVGKPVSSSCFSRDSASLVHVHLRI